MGKVIDSPDDSSLTVRDNRTGKTYTVPYASSAHGTHPFTSLLVCRIVNNSVPATAFKDISAPPRPDEREENETEKGLRVSDKGFLNTAVIQSEITYIDGEAGSLSIENNTRHKTFANYVF